MIEKMLKLQIMEDLLRIKFQDDELKKKLLSTKGKMLIEGNYWGDSFWESIIRKADKITLENY